MRIGNTVYTSSESVVFGTPILAYKVNWKDNKHKKSEAVFKLDGVIFAGYEFKDYDESGEVVRQIPSKEMLQMAARIKEMMDQLMSQGDPVGVLLDSKG